MSGIYWYWLFFIVSGESWTQSIVTADSGNKWFIFLYRAPVSSTPGSVFEALCSMFRSTVCFLSVIVHSLNSPSLLLFFTGLGPELEELLVEGFLLQVTLPETEQLYRYLLYKLAPLPSHNSPGRNGTEQDQHCQRGSPSHVKVMTITGTFFAWRSYSEIFLVRNHCCFGIFIFYVLKQNEGSGVKKETNGQSKRTKRRQDGSDSQHSEKAKKCRKKKSKKSKERSEETKRTSSPTHAMSDPAASDSEEDYSLCAAPWCREPEGDEVCCALYLTFLCPCFAQILST